MGDDAGMTLDTVERDALAQAQEQARAIRDEAQARARELVAAARAQADARLEEARGRANHQAELAERRRLAQARADAHALVLHAQRSVLVEARAAAHTAAAALREDPRYLRTRARLAAQAQARLTAVGPVQVAPTPDGGVIVRAGSLQIDHSLGAQVERCLQRSASELQRLWR